MINALRAQRLAAAHAPFDAWLYASDVVRNFPWSSWSRVSDAAWADDDGHCAAPLLAPTGPAAGANCVFLLPTPYELEAPPPPPLPPERSKFRDRLPVVYMRAGYARGTGSAPSRSARAAGTRARWLNVSVVGRGVERVAFSEFARYRYLLDVGGVSGTTWSALRAKLLSGSLVFKVELDWQDWWHAHLQPFRDYLPVSVDLSDLHERYAAAAIPTASRPSPPPPPPPPPCVSAGRGPPGRRRAHRAERRARRRRHERPARDARRRGVGADQRGGGRARHHGHGAAGVWHAAASV